MKRLSLLSVLFVLIIGTTYSETMNKFGLIGAINYSEPGLGIKYNFNNKISTEMVLSINYQKHFKVDTIPRKLISENITLNPLIALYYNINKNTKPNIFTGLYFSYLYNSEWQNMLHAGIPIGLEYFINDKMSIFIVSGIDFAYDFYDYYYYSFVYGFPECFTIGFSSTRLGITIYIK
jgi:hypothetical protein